MHTESGIFKRFRRISLKPKPKQINRHINIYFIGLLYKRRRVSLFQAYWWHWTMDDTRIFFINIAMTQWPIVSKQYDILRQLSLSLYMNDHNTVEVFRVSIVVCSQAQKPYRLMKALRCNLEFIQWPPQWCWAFISRENIDSLLFHWRILWLNIYLIGFQANRDGGCPGKTTTSINSIEMNPKKNKWAKSWNWRNGLKWINNFSSNFPSFFFSFFVCVISMIQCFGTDFQLKEMLRFSKWNRLTELARLCDGLNVM